MWAARTGTVRPLWTVSEGHGEDAQQGSPLSAESPQADARRTGSPLSIASESCSLHQSPPTIPHSTAEAEPLPLIQVLLPHLRVSRGV